MFNDVSTENQALCVLENQSNRPTLSICNIYCLSTAAIITRKRLNVTLDVHFLSSSFLLFQKASFVVYGMIILVNGSQSKF